MLTILVAHHAEGKAYLEHYAMRPDTTHPSGRRYTGDGVQLRIIGQGDRSVRQSLEDEFALNSKAIEGLWLNFGVAGSAEYELGDVLELNSVRAGEGNESESTYNFQLRGLATATQCQSFKQPQIDYPRTGVVDMEAFFIADKLALHNKLMNLVTIKLVVDGPQAPHTGLTRETLNQHLATAQSKLTEISDRLIIEE